MLIYIITDERTRQRVVKLIATNQAASFAATFADFVSSKRAFTSVAHSQDRARAATLRTIQPWLCVQ